MTKKRKNVSMKDQFREELAQKHYLNPDSPGYLNELKARELAGYSKSYAKSRSGNLWENTDIETLKDILPDDSKNIGEEIKKWLELMAKWREKLSEVKDPIKLGSRTFAVISSYIQGLAKMFGLIIDRQLKMELKGKYEEKHVYLHFDNKEKEINYHQDVISLHQERLKELEKVDNGKTERREE